MCGARKAARSILPFRTSTAPSAMTNCISLLERQALGRWHPPKPATSDTTCATRPSPLRRFARVFRATPENPRSGFQPQGHSLFLFSTAQYTAILARLLGGIAALGFERIRLGRFNLFGGSSAEGVKNVGQGQNAFQFPKVSTIDNRKNRPIAHPAQDLFEGFIRENHGEGTY